MEARLDVQARGRDKVWRNKTVEGFEAVQEVAGGHGRPTFGEGL